MKKSVKIILFSILAIVLVVLLAIGGTYMLYYPHYKSSQMEVSVAGSELKDGEIRVMSCNLRCKNTSDLGKKSWYYRADLIMKNIQVFWSFLFF